MSAAPAAAATPQITDDMSPLPFSLTLTALGAAGLHAGPALSSRVPVVCTRLGIRRQAVDSGTIALTFDDGPHPRATPRVLDLLAGAEAAATFFLVGEQVRNHPALARQIAAAGHAIGLHGDTHRNELRLTPRALAEDRRRGMRTIHDATGVMPVVHRPPYGAASAAGLALARRSGMQTVLWSRWGRDWRARADAASVARDVLGDGLGEREIILLHDADHYGAAGCWRATLGALPRILAGCRDAGLVTVTL
jgi:peptidoglycan/xylan/chitin deacetylase (PgdA/CDA1 family)